MNERRQINKIIAFCNEHGSITQRQAYKIGIYRLAACIFDMKKAGYLIDTELLRVKNRDGSFSRIAKYTILRSPEA